MPSSLKTQVICFYTVIDGEKIKGKSMEIEMLLSLLID